MGVVVGDETLLRNKKAIVCWAAVVIVGVAVLSVFLYPSFIQDKKISHIKKVVSGDDSSKNNIAKEWQWDNFSSEDINSAISKAEKRVVDKKPSLSEDEQPFEFDVVVVYSALGAVELDDNGDVILDDETLAVLETGFNKLPENLTNDELEELLQLIKTGLPGSPGEQSADIVERYQSYKVAERDFTAVMPAPKDATEALAQFEQKIALRESILGYDAAKRLFSQEQSESLYMLKVMAIESDSSLSNEEKKEAARKLQSENILLKDNYSMNHPRDDDMVENNVIIMRQHGIDEKQIEDYRYEHLGEEKAKQIIEKEKNE